VRYILQAYPRVFMPSSLCYLYWSHAPPLLNKSCTPWFIDGTLSERQRMRDVLCPPTIRLLMSHLTWSNPRWQNLTGIRHNPLRNNQPFSRGGCFCEHSSTAVCKQPDIPFHTEKAVAYWDELQSELGLFATFTDYEADARVGTEWVQLGDWATRFRFGALDLTVEMQFWIDAFHQTLEAEAARDQLLLVRHEVTTIIVLR